jgi:hypothetical protein
MGRAAADERLASDVVADVDALAAVAGTLPDGDERIVALGRVAEHALQRLGPLRCRTAAALLGVTEKTVRSWERAGVLTAVVHEPRVLLDPVRVFEVRAILRDLRASGVTTGLLDAVAAELEDEDLLSDPVFLQTLEELRRSSG